MGDYLPRLVDPLITSTLAALPALMLVGPRAVGKTTTALRHARTVVRLDQPAEATAFIGDPDAALKGLPEPVLLDEWQEVPAVLSAVKRAVDSDGRPGRFILAGSVSAESADRMWGATGRVIRVPIFGMTVAERAGQGARATSFLDRLATGDMPANPVDPPDLLNYLELALRSGFPQAALTEQAEVRRRWLESYVEQLLTRDVLRVDGGRDPARLRRYLEAYALNSAGVVHDTTLFQAAGVNRKTADAYEALLERLYIVDRLTAWTTSRLKRLVLSPKRYVIDSALIAAATGMDAMAIRRHGDQLGRILDTFVVAQLRAELATAERRPRLHHLRAEHGRHEVDVLAEFGAGMVIAIEVKAGAAVTADDARHLVWLRDQLGSRFVHGVVFHTGPRVFSLGDRVTAVPICSMWALPA